MVFNHSVKVPRKYKLSASIVKQVSEGANLKTLLFSEKYKHWPVNTLYAIILETLKHEVILNKLFSELKLFENEQRLDPWLAKVLMVELLYGKKDLPQGSKPVDTVLSYLDKAKNLLAKFNIEVEENENQVLKPRYIRVNTLKIAVADVIRSFQDLGWKYIRCTSGSYEDYLKQLNNLTSDDFVQDYHVKTVFAFAPKTQLQEEQLYIDKTIFLQDKATSLVSTFLAPLPGSTILDMCAAPGMKTTHLAALIKNEGTIYSVENDTDRYKVLCKFVEEAGATCVKPINEDAFKINNKMCPNVDYILIDPSCSGSGMDRPEIVQQSEKDVRNRLKKLSSMQAKLLKHAFFAFPNTKRIVYSTCSLHPEENEEVISELASHRKSKFQLVSAKAILKDNWNNVGDLRYRGVGEKCLYARPKSDLTTGVFIAVFERIYNTEPIVTSNNKKEIMHADKSKREESCTLTVDDLGLYIDSDNVQLSISEETENKEKVKKPKMNKKYIPEDNDLSSLNVRDNVISLYNDNTNNSINKAKKKKKSKKENTVIPIDIDISSDNDSKSSVQLSISVETENKEKVKKPKKSKKDIPENDDPTSLSFIDNDISLYNDNTNNSINKAKKKKKSKKLKPDISIDYDICSDSGSMLLISSEEPKNNKVKKSKKNKSDFLKDNDLSLMSVKGNILSSFDEDNNDDENNMKKKNKVKRKERDISKNNNISQNDDNILLQMDEENNQKRRKKSKLTKPEFPKNNDHDNDNILSNYEDTNVDSVNMKMDKKLKRKHLNTSSDINVEFCDEQPFLNSEKSGDHVRIKKCKQKRAKIELTKQENTEEK